jgi:DNA repair protein RecO (recombination protein O)
MSNLIKTEAIVLRKIDYGDTSRIIHFFTKEYGKINAIVKGIRSPKSKIGSLLDIFNYVQVVLYKKETRDVQFIKEVELFKYYSIISENLHRLQYANAIIELLYSMTVENEDHQKLFVGSIRALDLINNIDKDPKLVFAKYFLFFIKEIGYEFPLRECSNCGNDINPDKEISYNLETGLICHNCSFEKIIHQKLSKELFYLLFCLNKKKNDISYNQSDLDKVITLLEKFLKYNIHEFKGLKSLEYIKK